MTRIVIALHQEFGDWEPALLMAVSRGYLGVEVATASPNGGPVTSMGGLKVTPDIAYSAIDPAGFDALVIPGGLVWERGDAPDFGPLVQAFHQQGKVVAGICAAASALAATGVLNDVAHTGNRLESHEKQPAYNGQKGYRDQPRAVSDGKVITAAGSSPVSFTAEVLKALDLWGPEAQAELAAFSAEHR